MSLRTASSLLTAVENVVIIDSCIHEVMDAHGVCFLLRGGSRAVGRFGACSFFYFFMVVLVHCT